MVRVMIDVSRWRPRGRHDLAWWQEPSERDYRDISKGTRRVRSSFNRWRGRAEQRRKAGARTKNELEIGDQYIKILGTEPKRPRNAKNMRLVNPFVFFYHNVCQQKRRLHKNQLMNLTRMPDVLYASLTASRVAAASWSICLLPHFPNFHPFFGST
jgi:hypothetical protein